MGVDAVMWIVIAAWVVLTVALAPLGVSAEHSIIGGVLVSAFDSFGFVFTVVLLYLVARAR